MKHSVQAAISYGCSVPYMGLSIVLLMMMMMMIIITIIK